MTKKELKEYEQAVEIVRSYGPYTLQTRDDEREPWRNVGKNIWGRDAAFEELARARKECEGTAVDPDNWRVLPKNDADKYREGLKHGLSLSDRGKIPAGMYLPDNL